MPDIATMLSDCESAKTCSNHPFEERGGLTAKQEETLEKIWEKI